MSEETRGARQEQTFAARQGNRESYPPGRKLSYPALRAYLDGVLAVIARVGPMAARTRPVFNVRVAGLWLPTWPGRA